MDDSELLNYQMRVRCEYPSVCANKLFNPIFCYINQQ